MAKLVDLKVVDLKRELEERDLDSSGQKSVLQSRLRQAMVIAGEDPETFVFDTGDVTKQLTNLKEELAKNLAENSTSLEKKLTENTNSLEKRLTEQLAENSTILEGKLSELAENNSKLREEFDSRISKFETDSKRLEDRLKTIEDRLLSSTSWKASEEEALESLAGDEAIQVDHKTSFTPPTGNSGIPTYDGKIPWQDFILLFNTAAAMHGWPAATKASMLCLSMRGDALGFLQTVPVAERTSYDSLVRRLEMRFGHRHMEQVYRSQLKNRVQRSNETLQEFEADIARMVRSAYPTVSDDVFESLAIERFLDGLREPETQQAVKLARPKTLSDALTQALEFEAVRQSVRGHVRIRAVNVEDDCSGSMEELIKKLLEALKTKKRDIRCWGCGEFGHPRSKCLARDSRKPQEN